MTCPTLSQADRDVQEVSKLLVPLFILQREMQILYRETARGPVQTLQKILSLQSLCLEAEGGRGEMPTNSGR